MATLDAYTKERTGNIDNRDVLDHGRNPRRREFPDNFSDLSETDIRFLWSKGWNSGDIAACFDGVTQARVCERLRTIGINPDSGKKGAVTGTARLLWKADPDTPLDELADELHAIQRGDE